MLGSGPFALAAGPDGTAPALPASVKSLPEPGLQNLFVLGANLFCGSAPEGEEGFASLARLGVKTILTVDGAKPDVAAAHKFGMRYLHIPHGYDGISTNTQAALVKAAQSAPGPIYIHCHHGLHRGPAAAAVICMANQGWSPAEGEALLKAAGTGSNYTGLYRTVRDFHPPAPEQLRAQPGVFPEQAEISGLIDLMVAIDERWDLLKAVRKAGYKTPPRHPDLQPAHEALILREHYREAQRLDEAARRGSDFLQRLRAAENASAELEDLLRTEPAAKSPALLDARFDAVAQACSACHKKYRDPAGISFHP